jgi:molybdopterin-binding protein
VIPPRVERHFPHADGREVTSASATRLELARGGAAYATFKATGTRLVAL